MVSVAYGDESTAEAFSEWLAYECPHADPRATGLGCGSLRRISGVDSQWGGAKVPECWVYAGTLNGADLGAVVAQFGKTRWRFPGQAQLLLMDQDESTFRLWMIEEGGPRQYAPIRDLTLGEWYDVMHPRDGEGC
jgi:hypothetical protein